jgi:fermentation-respiration switch protein FrsA (DUF1100 family)
MYMKKVGVNILVVSYRGYGHSEGSPNYDGITLDAQAILDYAFNHLNTNLINSHKIYTHGRSLGGATSISGIVNGG